MRKKSLLSSVLAILIATTFIIIGIHIQNSKILFRLNDSGSTNSPAWVLTVNTNGSGSLTNNKISGDVGASNGNKNFPANTFNISSLKDELRKLNLNKLPQCPQDLYLPPASENYGSASFGSVASLTYQGKTIEAMCQNNPVEVAISNQLNNIVSIANP